MRYFLPLFLICSVLGTGQPACAHDDVKSASALVKAGKWQEANQAFKEVLARQPRRADVHYMYGDFLKITGQTQEAVAELQRAIALNPKQPDAYADLAEIQLQQLDFDGATRNALSALNLAPNSRRARVVYVNALLQAGHTSQADNQLATLLSENKDDPEVLHLAFLIKERKGDFNQARAYLQQAVQSQPDNSDWLLDLCKLSENAGDYMTAQQLLRDELQRKPDDIPVRLRLARELEVYSRDYDGAIKEYMQCLQVDPECALALNGIDRCRARKNDLALKLKLTLQALFAPHQGH